MTAYENIRHSISEEILVCCVFCAMLFGGQKSRL